MRRMRFILLAVTALSIVAAQQQPPAPAQSGRGGGRGGRGGRPAGRKVVLAWADTRNGIAQHDSVSHALATIERLGYESGLWDTYIRTDSNIASYHPLMTNGQPASGGPSFNNVDAIFFMGHRDVAIDDKQKAELLKFVHDDGKGFVAAHVALTALMSWPEFGEMLGGQFQDHPYGSVAGTVINEDPSFPATRHLPVTFNLTDEFYQVKNFSREKSRVLLRLDPGKCEPHQQERRLPAGLGKDLRRRTRLLRLIRARCQDLGQPGCLSHVLRGHPVGPEAYGCGRDTAAAAGGGKRSFEIGL
jgi:uncharacterized protein